MSEQQEKQKHWLTQTEMSELLCVARQTLFRWGVEPVAKIGSNTYFTLQDVIENRVENALKHVTPSKPEDATLEYERYRLTKAQADAQEHKNRIADQQVAPLDFIAFVLSTAAAEIAGIIDSLPLNITRKHPELTVIQQENIKRELAKAMNAISRIDERMEDKLIEYVESSS